MARPVATVLIPTFNHGGTLSFAVGTALAQTVPVEVFIVGDGVPEPGRARILELVARDERIRFFDHPKHESRGEPYRHAALSEARGRIVCYLCDRDLWMPDHVERLAALLENADFAHSLSLHVMPGDGFRFYPVDLALPEHRERMLTRFNRVAFSCAAHTLDFYRQLERGWETTPQGKPTDWHMFQQFLERNDCRCFSGTWPSAITFPSPPRIDWSEEQRVAELKNWAAKIDTSGARHMLVTEILEAAVRDRDRELADTYRDRDRELADAYAAVRQIRDSRDRARQVLDDLYHSPWWRLHERIASIPGARKLLRRLARLRDS